MNTDELWKAIGDIDDSYVEEFAYGKTRAAKLPWGLIASAACFCLVIASAVLLHSAGLLPGARTDKPDPVVTVTTVPTESTEVPEMPCAEEIIRQVMGRAESTVKENSEIHIPTTEYTRIYIRQNSDALQDTVVSGGETAVLYTRKNEGAQKHLTYLVFLSVLEEEYAEYLISADLYYDTSYDRMPLDLYIFYPGYREAGFATIREWYDARTEDPEDWCLISYSDDRIVRYTATGDEIVIYKGGEFPTGKTAEQIAMETLFGDYGSWYNRALTCQYASPEKLSLRSVFYCGFQDEPEQTEEEWEALKDKPGFNENYDFFRLPADRMNEVLTEYFGITLEDVEDSGFAGLQYLESTDCYYFMTTGANVVDNFTAQSVETLEDGTVRLAYTAWYTNEAYIAILKPNGDGYLILSNRLAQ